MQSLRPWARRRALKSRALRKEGFLAVILPHNVNRVVVEADCSFAEFRDRYESMVPMQDNEKVKALGASGKSWLEILAEVNASTKYGFFIFWKMDVMPIMRVAGHNGECVEYLMGNYTIAERMFKHEPSVMLYAPLRTLIYTGKAGRTLFAIDQPTTIFDSFGDEAISEVGKELDDKVIALLAALGVPHSPFAA
jgi:uncharacterized protein (DUF302 family)